MASKSLKAQQNELSNTDRQLEILSNGVFQNGQLPTFKQKLKEHALAPIEPQKQPKQRALECGALEVVGVVQHAFLLQTSKIAVGKNLCISGSIYPGLSFPI